MPELPEVETIGRELRSVLVGRTIVKVETTPGRAFRYQDPEIFSGTLPGMRVSGISRRGKFLVVALRPGSYSLILHLGMTGHIRVASEEQEVAPHTYLRLFLDNGREVRFDDLRGFGRLLIGSFSLLAGSGAMPEMGPEPLGDEFDADFLKEAMHGARPVKTVLLDQRAAAGVGNIYADESLFMAGIYPERRADSLERREVEALVVAIQMVLEAALAGGGTSFDAYEDIWGAKGRYQDELLVYGRAGQPCRDCGRLIERMVIGGRATFYCPHCQERP